MSPDIQICFPLSLFLFSEESSWHILNKIGAISNSYKEDLPQEIRFKTGKMDVTF